MDIQNTLKNFGNLAAIPYGYISSSEGALNTSRAVGSLLGWAVSIPEHVPSKLLEVGARISEYAPQTVAVGGILLQGMCTQVNILKDHLQFLDIFARLPKLKDIQKLTTYKRISLGMQIASSGLMSFVILPGKWKWFDMATLSATAGRWTGYKDFSKSTFNHVKNACVLVSSTINAVEAWSNEAQAKKAIEAKRLRYEGVAGSQDLEAGNHRIVGLKTLKEAVESLRQLECNRDTLLARGKPEDLSSGDWEVLSASEKTIVEQEARLGVLLTSYASQDAKKARSAKKKNENELALKIKKSFQKFEENPLNLNDEAVALGKYIRKYSRGHLLASISNNLIEHNANLPLGLVSGIQKQEAKFKSRSEIVKRIIDHKISKNEARIKNLELDLAKADAGFYLELSKISIVSLELFGNIMQKFLKKETCGHLFWLNLLAIGATGLWRSKVNQKKYVEVPTGCDILA